MRVLALDTTTQPGSVAVIEKCVENGGDHASVVAGHIGDASRTHAERLPRDIMSLLERARVPLSAIDVFAVACGPGSFTGLRIGIATIQGLAFATERKVVPVSALDALAHVASVGAAAATTIGVWMDAHRREIFSALYRVGDAPEFVPERLIEIEAAAVGPPAATLARWNGMVQKSVQAKAWRFIGDGAALYSDAIGKEGPPGTTLVDTPALAAAIGRIAVVRAERGESVAPAAIRPLYVRRPDAEIARAK